MLMVITVVSVLIALAMSAVAWRATRAERERSEARIEALARDIHDDIRFRAVDAAPAGSEMFAVAAQSAPSGSRWGLAIAVGAFVVASFAALLVVFGGEGPGTRVALASTSPRPSGLQPTPQPVAAQAPAELPLELLALAHERDGNQLTVRGVVRNPASSTEMDRLTAVVVLLNRDGDVITTARAVVASPALLPGGESTFTITVPDAGDIGRYRVSFRTGERVIPHVDRRTGP